MNRHSNPNDGTPSATVDVLEPGTRRKRGYTGLKIGRDLEIEPRLLSRYCLKDLQPVLYDMVLLSASIALADRVVARRPSVAWRREICVNVPVHDPDRWREPALYRKLIDTLDFLTGDNWDIEFKPRKLRITVQPQAPLNFFQGGTLVMPYSDGLDSFAVSRLTVAKNRGTPLVLVTTGNRKNRALDASNSSASSAMYRVAIPFRLHSQTGSVRHREPSYRSRAFAFGIMAGIASYLLNATTILIPESGQGSLGPWLLPVGKEARDVRMHPFFTNRLAALLNHILETKLEHVHPQLWKTKGETLRELADNDLSEGWWLTSSCARDQRHVSRHKRRIQCGVCAGCLLRRQSLSAANLQHDSDIYLWDDLNAPSLKRAAKGRPVTLNDKQQALSAVFEAQKFAELSGQPAQIKLAAEELSEGVTETPEDVEAKLTHLLQTHSTEWQSFRQQLHPESFINLALDELK